MSAKPEHRIDGGGTYPPTFEVVIHGSTVHVCDSSIEAAQVFVKSCAARGIELPDNSDEWWETSASWGLNLAADPEGGETK